MKIPLNRKSFAVFGGGLFAGSVLAVAALLLVPVHPDKPLKLVSPVLAAAIGKATPPSTEVRVSLDIPRRQRMASQIYSLQANLDTTQSQLAAVTEERDAAFGELSQLADELLLTYGTFEEAGAKIGAFILRLDEIEAALVHNESPDPQRDALLKEWFSFMAVSDSIRDLDSEPREASRYQTAVYKQIASLSEFESSQVRAILDRAYGAAAANGINLASRPEENPADWTLQREQFYQGVYVQIQQALTREKAALIDEQRSYIGVDVWNGVDPFSVDMLLDYGF